MKNYRILMLTTLIISGCSMVYELIISAVSSYLLGDSTFQYSVTIGLYMFALGIGSFLSKYIKKDLFNSFAMVEICIGLIGGTSSLVLFLANLYIESYACVMYIEIILIGTLAGLEIPLLTRIIEEDRNELRLTLSSIFSFDYIGGLIGAIVFPMLLLPHLGYFATAFLAGAFNLICATVIIFSFKNRLKKSFLFRIASVVLLVIMAIGMVFSENISRVIESGLYRDNVILIEQTQYQKIVVTKHKEDVRLFIDGNCQFSSADEYRYHESLVHIPMLYAEKHEKVLILGGGDGLAVRELLKYPDIKQITMIDLDKGMTDLCRADKQISKINEGSLNSDKLTIINMDAYQYLKETDGLFDVIIVDLPDPNNEALNKLYSNIFYRLCGNHLTDNGIINVQSTSPYYAPKAFWCINRTIESEGFEVKPYHLQVPSFGDWGFNMASRAVLEKKHKLAVDTRYLSEDNIESLFSFAKDEVDTNTDINQLTKPILIQYYNEAVKDWE